MKKENESKKLTTSDIIVIIFAIILGLMTIEYPAIFGIILIVLVIKIVVDGISKVSKTNKGDE